MLYPPGAANSIHAEYFKDVLRYWRREPLTRLFRVSRAVRAEAQEIVYSHLTLLWKEQGLRHNVNRNNIQGFVIRTLGRISPGVRESIRRIALDIHLRAIGNKRSSFASICCNFSKLKWKNAIAHIVWGLPGLRKVQAVFTFYPADEPLNIQDTAELMLDIISPLQELNLWDLSVKTIDDIGRTGVEINAVIEIIKRMNDAIRSGDW